MLPELETEQSLNIEEVSVENPLAEALVQLSADYHDAHPVSIIRAAEKKLEQTPMQHNALAFRYVDLGERSPFFDPASDLVKGITPYFIGKEQEPSKVIKLYLRQVAEFCDWVKYSDMRTGIYETFLGGKINFHVLQGIDGWMKRKLEALHREMLPAAFKFRDETYAQLARIERTNSKGIAYEINPADGSLTEIMRMPAHINKFNANRIFVNNSELKLEHADEPELFTSVWQTMTDPLVRHLIYKEYKLLRSNGLRR